MESASSRRNLSWQRLTDLGLPAELQLWRVDLDRNSVSADVLSHDERERAARFRFPIHRERFIAGRATLRVLLAEALNAEPGELVFQYSETGKPSLAGLWFNLAHSENTALIALAPFRVGVDVEIARSVELDLLAANVFSEAELKIWRSLEPHEKPDSFYAVWTRKEALLKGIGCGISEHVKAVSALFRNNDPIVVPPTIDRGKWVCHSFRVEQGCPAAVAFEIN